MMKIHTLTLGDYMTNTYIVHDCDSASCAIIDPGYQAKTILARVQELGLKVDAILLTHGHFDHVGAVRGIVEATGCRLWMHKQDWAQKPSPVISFFYPLINCDFTDDLVLFCDENEPINAGGLRFFVMETPGHTQGSVCYLCDDAMFSGDTLFEGSCGRTDLPGGDWDTIRYSLRRLASIQNADFTIYPGHGGSTTLEREMQYNPLMR